MVKGTEESCVYPSSDGGGTPSVSHREMGGAPVIPEAGIDGVITPRAELHAIRTVRPDPGTPVREVYVMPIMG